MAIDDCIRPMIASRPGPRLLLPPGRVSRAGLLMLSLLLAACTSVRASEPAPQHTTASSDGVPIAFEQRGTGEPALVFVHGWCGDRALWNTTMESLAPSWRVIALDLAGHGSSGSERRSWTLDSLADDVVAVVTASGARQVILVGHSMGATVALLAAPRLAPRVLGIVAIDSLHDARFTYPRGYLEGAAADLERDFSRALEASFSATLSEQGQSPVMAWLLERANRTDRDAAVGLLRGLEGFELAPVLAAAGVPVRAINAAPSEIRPLVTQVEHNRELADYEAVLIEEVGHFPMLERPTRFRTLLVRWIEELRKPSSGQTPPPHTAPPSVRTP